MEDQAQTNADRPLSVQLDLRLNSDPISGWIRCERAPAEQFVGWLGFVEALRRLSEAQSQERS
jgi:hypothetical protein